MRYVLILSVLLSIYSCDTEKRIGKKVNKFGPEKVLAYLQKHNKDLFITKVDTVKDTVYIKSIEVDTVFRLSTIKDYDTLTVYKDRLKVKIIKVGDTIRVSGECAGDTIYRQLPCPEKVVPVRDFNGNKYQKYLLPFFLLLAIIAVVFFISHTHKDK